MLRDTILFLLAASVSAASAQQQPKAPPPPDLSNTSTSTSRTPMTGDPQQARIEGIQKRMQQEDRQKKLQEASERLFALSGEIKAQIEKAPQGSVSLEVARKAAEAAKLARELEKLSKE